jgi:hypothetical protein
MSPLAAAPKTWRRDPVLARTLCVEALGNAHIREKSAHEHARLLYVDECARTDGAWTAP